MKRFLIVLLVLLSTMLLAYDPFLAQTGGNAVLATGYWSIYGAPSDLFGIEHPGASAQFVEVTKPGTNSMERNFHIAIFENTSDKIAGALEFTADVMNEGNSSSLGYLASGSVGTANTFGLKLELAVDDISSPATSISVRACGGISGKGLDNLEYTAFFNNATVWSPAPSSDRKLVDFGLGLRYTLKNARIGIEVGTRSGMDIRYGGLSGDIQLMDYLTIRAGMSVNSDLDNNVDYVLGGGVEINVGGMKISGGYSKNLNYFLENENFEVDSMWSVSLSGTW